MTFEQAQGEIERKGWRVLAQRRHDNGLVSYDAMKGQGKWPHGRKLAKGEPREWPHGAMAALLRACIERDLPKYRRRVTVTSA